MDDAEFARGLGALEGRMGALEKEVKQLRCDVRKDAEAMAADVTSIRSILDSAGGSWKALLAIGGFIAAVAATLAAIATWLSVAPR